MFPSAMPGSTGYQLTASVLDVDSDDAALAGWDGSVITSWSTASSSLKYKEDIRPLEIESSKILELTPKSFKLKKGVGSTLPGTFGYIAEEVEKIIPELVQYTDKGEADGLFYPLIPVLLVEEIKKLKARIDVLESS